MPEAALHSAVARLRQAIGQCFPERAELVASPFDGSLAQAWEAWARLLGRSPVDLATALAPCYGVGAAGPLDRFTSEALALLPSGFCQQHNILPLRIEDHALLVATSDPLDDNLGERVRFLANRPVRWVLAPPGEVEDAIVFAYAKEAERLSGQGDARGSGAQAGIDEHAIVKLGRGLIVDAIGQRASDLHIQPYLGAFVARIRVDGVLRRLAMVPDAVAISLLRHLKTRSGMSAANTQMPQDGRMSLVIQGREYEVRVSSLPATRGERLVLRFLDQSRVHSLSRANFSRASLQIMRRGIARPSGLVVMTGPTGCGKTSTLYGMIAELNKSTVNIITVEDPVEYRIPGVSQVEVNDKAGRSFMAALRAILRQDPDIVLIGEIRDEETAEIACKAALTGHLVLSTLHTNDALTAIPRLLNLGVQPGMLADALALVIAQRLCRVLCSACKRPATDPLSAEERSFLELTHNRPGHRAVGCKACNYTGYLGRLPIVDIIEMNPALRDAVAGGESRISELGKLREGGLRSLAASGSLRIISGDTTVAEVRESVGPGFWSELAEHYGGACDGLTVDPVPQHVKPGQAALIISPQPGLVDPLAAALEHDGLHLIVAADAETAHALLEQDEEIAFIIGDLPDDATPEQAIEQLRHNRLHISWARLPAAILLPAALAGHEARLRDSGVMGDLLIKPVTPSALVERIHRARAR